MHKNLRTHHHSKNDCGNASSNKAFPSLFGAELNEGSFSKKEPEHVCHDVIDDNHRDRNNKPNHALENVNDDEIALRDHNEECDVGPRKQRELAHVISLLQRQHKPYKTNDVHRERNESVVCDQES